MNTIKIMSYNIHSAIGRDGKADVRRIAELSRASDIVALQEVDNFWNRSGNVSQSDLFVEYLDGYHAAWQPNIDLHKEGRRRRQFGNLLLSRYPILSVKRHCLPKTVQVNRLGLQSGVLEAIVALPIGDVRIYATHLLTSDCTLQARRLLEILSWSSPEGLPITGKNDDSTWSDEPLLSRIPEHSIFLGDLNIRPGSYEHRLICHGGSNADDLHENVLIDAWLAQGSREVQAEFQETEGDEGATYYIDFDKKVGERLDYCFISRGISTLVDRCEVLEEVDYSDHQPLIVTLDGSKRARELGGV